MTCKDEAIERIRQARQAISEAHGHDPYRLVEYYRALQTRHKLRLRQRQPASTVKERET